MKVQLTCLGCGKIYYRTPSAAKNSKFCSNACRAKAMGDVYLTDLTGQRFGRLTVIERVPNKDDRVMWLCQCDCGKRITTGAHGLKQGRTKSCGCYKAEINKEQYTRLFVKPIEPGTKFSRLVVLSEYGRKHGLVTYLCRCDCGKEVVVRSADLRRGTTKSCGCYSADRIGNLRRTHGLSGTREYNHSRRVKRRYADNGWTSDMAKSLFELQPVCVVCSSGIDLAVDHVTPVTKGGLLRPGNAVVLCKSCNSFKNNKDLEELPALMAFSIIVAAQDFWQSWETSYQPVN